MKLEIRKIDPFVGELLFDHDCVIITDLGGFVASYRAAAVNPALHVISPPAKRIAFNGSLRNNDGLLAKHIATNTGMTYPDACDTIRNYVNEAFRQMESGKRFPIDKVGVLYMDGQRNLQFIPDTQSNFLTASFGLSPVHTPVIRRDVPEPEQQEAVVIPFTLPAKRKDRRRFGILETIPAAAVLAILFIIPPPLASINKQLSGMLPFSRIEEFIDNLTGKNQNAYQVQLPKYESPFLVPPGATGSGESTTPPASSGQQPVTPPAPVQPVPAQKEASSVLPSASAEAAIPASGFHVIGGCFRQVSNAEAFVGAMRSRGMDARIIGQSETGLYMVSLYHADSKAQAVVKLVEANSDAGTRSWIYEVKP